MINRSRDGVLEELHDCRHRCRYAVISEQRDRVMEQWDMGSDQDMQRCRDEPI